MAEKSVAFPERARWRPEKSPIRRSPNRRSKWFLLRRALPSDCQFSSSLRTASFRLGPFTFTSRLDCPAETFKNARSSQLMTSVIFLQIKTESKSTFYYIFILYDYYEINWSLKNHRHSHEVNDDLRWTMKYKTVFSAGPSIINGILSQLNDQWYEKSCLYKWHMLTHCQIMEIMKNYSY